MQTFSRQLISFVDRKDIVIDYVNHHQAHASSFFFSPSMKHRFSQLMLLVKKQCVTFGSGKGNKIEILWSQEFPHSLGSFYSALTSFLGFSAQSDEWKLMGASAYGNSDSVFYPRLRSLFNYLDDGGFELDLTYFNHYQFHRPSYFTTKNDRSYWVAAFGEGRFIGRRVL